MCRWKFPHVSSFMPEGLILWLYAESTEQSGMWGRRCFRTDPAARPSSGSVTLWGTARPGGRLLAAGGSLLWESGQTSRARACSVGHRCICMSVLGWVRSVLLEQVRPLSPLPADVRALPSGLPARGRLSVWVLPNQEMFPPGNTHSVSWTSLVQLKVKPTGGSVDTCPRGRALRSCAAGCCHSLPSLSLSRPGTNSRCPGKTVEVQARSSAFPICFPSFQQSESHKLPEAEMVSLV